MVEKSKNCSKADPRFRNSIFDGKSIEEYLEQYADALHQALGSVGKNDLERVVDVLLEVIEQNNTIFVAGNGGSAAIADHLGCDWTKGTCVVGQNSLRTHSLVSNSALFTALANDFSYEDVFSKQLEMFARPGDALVLISSSGNSANILKAVDVAKKLSVRTVGLTGFSGGKLASLVDINLHIDYSNYGVVEDGHQVLMHTLAQFLVRARDRKEKSKLATVGKLYPVKS